MERRDLSREPENLKETPRGMPSQRPRGKGCRSMPLLAQTRAAHCCVQTLLSGGSDYARGGVAPGVCGPSHESGCRDDVPRSHASPERCALSFTLSDCCNCPRASRRDTPRSTAFSSPSPAACGLLAAHRQEHTTQDFSRVPPTNKLSRPQRCGHEPFYPSLVRI